MFVNPIKEFLILQEGSQWTYTIPGVNQFNLNLFYQPEVDPLLWDIVLDSTQGGGNVELRVSDGKELVVSRANAFVASEPGVGFLPGPNSLGFYVTDFYVGLQLDRPCVKLTAADGVARDILDPMRIEYAPIIQRDLPAPIAYKHKDFGVITLGAAEQAEDLPDNDPTTCQNFEETPMAIMQDRMQGNVIDITLPFCESTDVCATVASTIFDYQSYTNAQTFTLTCGPDDEPELGAAVSGFDSNLRIESINYSFTDGSAYTIEVTLGPVFANIGSWQNGAWTRRREDVSRSAIVIWTAGDGINYRVMVQGLGVFNAFNTAQDPNAIWRVGERVNVTIRNAPIEE